ncbi:hypothetical protein ABGB09_35265 [Streptomyces sp. B8F3]|uniref:hypothetical protein n=1 Tax=Streptomyces sp. B8F3 TaxID=3153573 RepID=UPI00325E1B83
MGGGGFGWDGAGEPALVRPLPAPVIRIAAPPGDTYTRACQPVRGSPASATVTATVVASPGRSVPYVALNRSHPASVPTRQSTGVPPDARSRRYVVSPAGHASTVSRPGPVPARPGAGPPRSTTSTDTSGRLPSDDPGPESSYALPAFSTGRPSSDSGASASALGGGQPDCTSPVAGAPRFAAHSASTGAAMTVATTVDVTARERSRPRRAARCRGSRG